MTLQAFLPLAAALLCGGLAVWVYLMDTRSLVHRAFAAGMIALALEAALTSLSFQAMSPGEVFRWQGLRLVATALLPSSWLLFSLSFARANYKAFVAKWRWVSLAAFAVPFALALATVWVNAFFPGASIQEASPGWLLRLGGFGHLFYLVFLLSAVSILMNLEQTLRASTGSMRERVRFIVLGLGGLFAVRVYTSSQVLLFSAVNTELEVFNAGALLVADGLILLSLVRTQLLNGEIYLSQAFLCNSLTTLIVGIYLLTVGVLARVIRHVGDPQGLPLHAFLMFLAFLGLTVILLSDHLRQQIKRFISRHFQRPRYDYRKEWTAFTRRTASLVEMRDLCVAVARMVSETFGAPAVTLWLWDEAQEGLVSGGSTAGVAVPAPGFRIAEKGAADLVRAMREQPMPVDCDRPAADWAMMLKRDDLDHFAKTPIRYCAPLVAGGEVVGVLTLSERLTQEPFSLEDFELFKTIADQAAGSLLHLKLSQRLMKSREMEAFQTFSAFLLHDLKNLASTLSMTMRNLPVHFDDPEFRQDALCAISQSVARIDSLCGRLSLLGQTLALQRTAADLNELVTGTLAGLNGCVKAPLVQELWPVPRLLMDPEQMRKVLVNLVLNATEAVGNGGEIRVTTRQQNGWVVLAVSDNGCGMSKAFIEKALFRPFQTTKKRGLGIGLFHSKMIVEAHQGRIEVESQEGKGSTFQVMLPAREDC